jgi:hypothetical protein
LLEYLAEVLWQDNAFIFMRGCMTQDPMFKLSPFNDNTFGFLDFVEELRSRMRSIPSAEVIDAADQAKIRGDTQTASVLEKFLPFLSSSIAMSSTSVESERIIRDHVRDSQIFQKRVSTFIDNFTPLDLSTKELSPSIPAQTYNVSDPMSWPSVSPDGVLPHFASSFEFSPCSSLQKLDEEYRQGLVLPCGRRKPSVLALETYYGPSVRTGSLSSGFSYRSKRVRSGSQRVDNEFSKRKPFYDIIDAEGDAGVARLNTLVASKYTSQSLESTNWLLSHLKRELIEADPIRRARSEAAKAGAAKSTKRHRSVAAPDDGATIEAEAS